MTRPNEALRTKLLCRPTGIVTAGLAGILSLAVFTAGATAQENTQNQNQEQQRTSTENGTAVEERDYYTDEQSDDSIYDTEGLDEEDFGTDEFGVNEADDFGTDEFGTDDYWTDDFGADDGFMSDEGLYGDFSLLDDDYGDVRDTGGEIGIYDETEGGLTDFGFGDDEEMYNYDAEYGQDYDDQFGFEGTGNENAYETDEAWFEGWFDEN